MYGWYNVPWILKELETRLVRSNDRMEEFSLSSAIDRQPTEESALVTLLKICTEKKDLYLASQVHTHALERGFLERSTGIGNQLVILYAKCSVLAKAQELFDEVPVRDGVLWTALIAGYAQHGYGEKALACFEQMRCEGFPPNAVILVCILKVCGSMRAAGKGKEIHAEIFREGLLERNILVGTAMVDMYAKCGALAKAQEVFDELPVQNIVSWTALIAGYIQHGHGKEALNCFERMQGEGLSPDAVTFACVLKACGSIGAADKGKVIHAKIIREGLLEKDVLLGAALLDMYVKCGALAKAQEVFNELPIRNVVSWNVLISGYIQYGHAEEALTCFRQMQCKGFSPDTVTFLCVLKACGNIGATNKGKDVHIDIARKGLLEKDVLVGTALVNMYAKCGALAIAQEVFDELPVRTVVTWNALITGYSQFGMDGIVIDSFKKMTREGIKPDGVTFMVVLNACRHSGLVNDGCIFFETMRNYYGIIPTLEHHTCMVDLYSRAGHFDKAVAMIKEMPSSAYLPVWGALLGACQKWGNVRLGKLAFEHVIQMDDKDAAAYACMKNIYAAAGMQEDANKVEALRVKNKAWKKPGHCWWTDASGSVHSFSTEDKSYLQNKSIYAKLLDLSYKVSQEGSSSFSLTSQGLFNNPRKDMLCGHNEKVAIACALVNTREGAPIHVMKTMRVCGDCHFDISLISKMEMRKILVRDANCCHIFEGGKCSCEKCHK